MLKYDASDIDLDDYILLAVFNRVMPAFEKTPISSSAGIERVKRTCQFLERVGLVESHKKSFFGYRPKGTMIEIILKRGLGPSRINATVRTLSSQDDEVLQARCAANKVKDEVPWHVLHMLGLVHVNRKSYDISTRKLREFVVEEG